MMSCCRQSRLKGSKGLGQSRVSRQSCRTPFFEGVFSVRACFRRFFRVRAWSGLVLVLENWRSYLSKAISFFVEAGDSRIPCSDP